MAKRTCWRATEHPLSEIQNLNQANGVILLRVRLDNESLLSNVVYSGGKWYRTRPSFEKKGVVVPTREINPQRIVSWFMKELTIPKSNSDSDENLDRKGD